MALDGTRPDRKPYDYFTPFMRWFWLLVLCTAIGAIGAFVVTKLQKPVYKATTVLVVNGTGTTPLPQAASIQATMYARLIVQPGVMQLAARQAGGITAADMAQRIQASSESNIALIDISADDTSPKRAAQLANSVASAFISVLGEQGLSDTYPAEIVQPAIAPTAPDHPNPVINALVGAVLGLALGIVVIHLLSWLNDQPPTPVNNERQDDERQDDVSRLNGNKATDQQQAHSM